MILWEKSQLKTEKAALKKTLVTYFVVLAVWLAVCVSLLLLSKGHDYFWFAFGAITLSVLFGWWSVYTFTNTVYDARKRLRAHETISKALSYSERGELVKVEEVTKDGLSTYSVTFEVKDGLRTVYSLSEKALKLEAGKEYKFLLCANYVVQCEEA